MADIQRPRESWKIKNICGDPNLRITDIPSLPVLWDPIGNKAIEIEAMDYTTANILSASVSYRNLLNSNPPKISSTGYMHDHIGGYDVGSGESLPDATRWHSHNGLSILTAGIASNADALHTHDQFVTSDEVRSLISDSVVSLDDYVRKDAEINQISGITSTSAEVEEAISQAHDENHTLLEHTDDVSPFTIANLRKLFDGSNADCLHSHSFYESILHNDLEDLQGGEDDQYYHLNLSNYTEITNFFNNTDITGAEAEILTNGSNADALHTHSGAGISGIHNDLEGLQGGTSYDPSALAEYYHLNYDQYITLTGGPSVYADDLHTHAGVSGIHNDLIGLNEGDYIHLTAEEYSNFQILTGGPSVYADDLHTHSFATTADLIPLGEACDSSWEDGLFQWTNETMTACAIDDINELLSSLAPPPAPSLDNASVTTSGTTANLSFDSSNPIGEGLYSGVDGIGALSAVAVDGAFTDSGYRTGVIGLNTDVVGTLNDDVSAHAYSYPADAFGNADQGELILELNGVEVRTIDLSTAGAVDDGLATSGFTISDHASVEFSNGDPFTQFQYRTGTWRVDGSTLTTDMRLGWNYVRIIHRISGVDTVTNYVDWVVDGNQTTTDYSGITFDNLVMTHHGDNSDYLSGVKYYRHGTAQYDITVKHGQRNTWKSGNAITFTGSHGSITSQPFSNTGGNELQDTVFTNLTFTVITSHRLLNENISVYTSVDRTINAYENPSSTSTISSILMDDLIDHTSTENDTEDFDGEGYRVQSDLDIEVTAGYGSGPGNCPAVWDPTQSLVGADGGHNDGLLVYNSQLQYPTQGLLGGDFRDNSDGGTLVYAPSGNPTYTGATGNRVYLRYFYDSTARQNFTFSFTFSNTTFGAVGGSYPSGNVVTAEILAPNTTINGSDEVEWKDMVTAYTVDSGIGAYASTYGSNINGGSPNSWGVTIGSKSTANSGYVIVVRITASSSWTGSISNIACDFL